MDRYTVRGVRGAYRTRSKPKHVDEGAAEVFSLRAWSPADAERRAQAAGIWVLGVELVGRGSSPMPCTCGYSLEGLTVTRGRIVCPECGRVFPLAGLDRDRADGHRLVGCMSLTLAALGLAGVLMIGFGYLVVLLIRL